MPALRAEVEKAGKGEEERRSFIGSVRERLLTLGDMDPTLRVLTLAALGAVVLVALIIAARDLPMPTLAVANSEVLPVPIFAAAVALLAISEAYLLTGALHSHGAIRLVAVALYSVAMYLTFPRAGFADLVWLVLLLGVWAAALTLWIGDRRNRGPRPERTAHHHLRLTDFCIFLAFTAAFFVNGVLGSPTGWFSSEIESQLVFLSFALACVLLFAGTDFAEWAQLVAEGLVSFVDQHLVQLVSAIALVVVSVVVLVDKVTEYGWTDLASQAIETLLLIGLVAGAVWVSRQRRGGTRVPVPAVLLVIAVLVVLVLDVNLLPILLPGTTATGLAGLEALGWIPIAAAAILVWLTTDEEPVRAGALFVFLVGIVYILESGVGTGPRTLTAPVSAFAALNRGGLQGGVAIIAIVTAVASIAGPRGRRVAGPLLGPLIELTVALQILSWLWDAFNGAIVGGAQFSVLQAIVIVVALFWDVLTSGEAVTNVHGERVPRHARVLVYLGYVLLVACAILFFSSVRGLNHQLAETWFESEAWPQLGIQRLGVPLVLAIFVLRLASGGHEEVEKPVAPVPESA
jgi:hypothetical protein